MDQTDVWMLGVVAFGIVFYLLAQHFQREGKQEQNKEDN